MDGVNGVVVSAKSLTAEAFAAGIMRALTLLRIDPGLRLRAREVSARFEVERHVESLLELLRSAAAGPSTQAGR